MNENDTTVISEKPEERKILTVSESLIYLMARFPDLDYSLLNPSWLEYDYLRKIYEDLTAFKVSGESADLTLLSRNHPSFEAIYSCGDESPNLVPSKFSIYLAIAEYDFNSGSVLTLFKDCSILPNKVAIGKILNFADKMRSGNGNELKVFEAEKYALEYLDELEALKGKPEPELKTGFPRLDEYLWGLHRGELVVFGARPAIGKSTLMLNFAAHLLKGGHKVLFFSTEMSAHEQWSRILPILTGINAFNFRKAKFDDYEWGLIVEKIGWLREQGKFIVCDNASPDFNQIVTLVRRYKPDVVILDFLQRFSMPDADRMDLSIGSFLKDVKTMSRTENVSVLIPSQLNRQVEGRVNKIPALSDLRESGNIEQEADIVILLGLDEEKSDDTKKIINMYVAKNRHGMIGVLKVHFDPIKLTMGESEIRNDE